MTDSARKKLQAVKGMHDLYEDAAPLDLQTWRRLEHVARETFLAYGFGEIRTPLVEDVELFVRGVGEATDIVGKEMFVFPARGAMASAAGEPLVCLRPENTAGVVRAMLEAGRIAADRYDKVFYVGPQFRNERPQAGRYRQFHQIGCEALGWADAAADVEVIALVHTLLDRLGVGGDAKLHLNTLGDAADRPRYRDALVAYFAPHRAGLSEDSRTRLDTNPLRILDSKDDRDRALCAAAPKPAAFLSDDAGAHFEAVKRGLTALGIPYVVDETLVRGLDYYTRTVFEFVGAAGLGAQSTVAAGGRYDGLVEELGGRPTPAVGFAAGIERLVLSMRALGKHVAPSGPTIVLVHMGDDGRARCDQLAFGLRARGVRVGLELRSRKVGAQVGHASKQGARFTLTIGSSEIGSGSGKLKDMSATGVERDVALTVDALLEALSKENG